MSLNTNLSKAALEMVRLTDVGLVRDHNEDAVASDENLGFAILADGMGGYKAGEVASEMAVLSIAAELTEALTGDSQYVYNLHSNNDDAEAYPELGFLQNAVINANNSIYQVSKNLAECEGMGTTLVLSLFVGNKVLVGHIGDSRMYCLRNQTLHQLTEDHSLLQEQINAGFISLEQAKFATHKNLVTRALGIDAQVDLALQVLDVELDDVYLLCSDGLTDMVDDVDIENILNMPAVNLQKTGQALVLKANELGGHDNISVILIRVNAYFKREVVQRSQLGASERSLEHFFGWLK